MPLLDVISSLYLIYLNGLNGSRVSLTITMEYHFESFYCRNIVRMKWPHFTFQDNWQQFNSNHLDGGYFNCRSRAYAIYLNIYLLFIFHLIRFYSVSSLPFVSIYFYLLVKSAFVWTESHIFLKAFFHLKYFLPFIHFHLSISLWFRFVFASVFLYFTSCPFLCSFHFIWVSYRTIKKRSYVNITRWILLKSLYSRFKERKRDTERRFL